MALLPRFGEVHLPPFWEQYINDENTVERFIPIRCRWLFHSTVIRCRSHAGNSRLCLATCSVNAGVDSGEESEQIELLNIRKETHEELR